MTVRREVFAGWTPRSKAIPVRALWLDGGCQPRGGMEPEAQMASNIPVSHPTGSCRKASTTASRKGSHEMVGANVRRTTGPCGRMSLRLELGGSGPWWGRLLVLRECASGLPRQAWGDSQWPADLSHAYGVGSCPDRWAATMGHRHKPDWGGPNGIRPDVSSNLGNR